MARSFGSPGKNEETAILKIFICKMRESTESKLLCMYHNYALAPEIILILLKNSFLEHIVESKFASRCMKIEENYPCTLFC